MSLGSLLILPIALLSVAEGSARAQERDDAAFDVAVRRDDEFRRAQFVSAGLPSIDAVAKSGRTVRRMWLHGFYPVGFPVMELERMPDGSIFFSVLRSGAVIQRMRIEKKTWHDITAQDADVFKAPTPPAPQPNPPTSACHGDVAYFEAAERGRSRTAGAMACVGALWPFNAARRSSVDTFARLAHEALGCARIAERDEVSSLVNCIGLKQRGGK